MAIGDAAVHPVKAARGARGERLLDVAGNAGVSISYLSMVEHGYVPPLAVRVRIAAALDRPETELWPA